MLSKRLIGVVTIKNGLVVQSFGYNRYLPIGKPEIVVKNLHRWGTDEIMVNVIDKSLKKEGPDFELIERIQSLNLNTPIVYGGGISSLEDAKKIIAYGADRILVESAINRDLSIIKKISAVLGAQALILSLPISINSKDEIVQFDYIKKIENKISKNFLKIIESELISEILITDYKNEGYCDKFNTKILDNFPIKNKSLICFGGIQSIKKVNNIIKNNNVSAIAIGNSLNYRENSIQNLKKKLKNYSFRKPLFFKEC